MERGFSVKNSLLVANLATKSLVAHRIVCDHMKFNNVSVEDVEIWPTFCYSVKHTRLRYSTYLEEQKKDKFQNVRSHKQKQVQKKITAVNKKKAMLENTIQECRQVCCGCQNVSK